MTKPISPDEVGHYAQSAFPEFVFAAVNDLLAQKFSGRSCDIKQEEIVDQMIFRANEAKIELSRNDIFRLGYLNFEEAYRAQGWRVQYDKPCYYGGDNYEAFFTFSRKK